MIRINLIPPEYEEAQSKKEQRIIFGSLGGVFVIFLLLLWVVKTTQASSLQRKIVDAEAKLKQYQAVVAQIEAIESQTKKLKAKKEVISNLNKDRLIYPVVFEDLLPLIPSDVWLTSLTVQEIAGNQRKLVMASKALSNFAVATWLTNLNQSTHFSGIKLSGIGYQKSKEAQTQELTFNLDVIHQHKGPLPLSEFN